MLLPTLFSVLSLSAAPLPAVAPQVHASNAPRRCQVGGYSWTFGDPVVQRDQTGNFPFEAFHVLGKRVAQACDNLKQRQVDIAQAAADQESAAIVFQHTLEIAEEFWHAVAPKVLAAPARGRPLLLKIKPTRDRMVGIVNFDNEIGNRQLQLVGP